MLTYYKILKEDTDALLLETGDFILLENYFYDTVTKPITYAVKSTKSANTKSLEYQVKVVSSVASVKSLAYSVLAASVTTKSLVYRIFTVKTRTLGVEYVIFSDLYTVDDDPYRRFDY